MQEESPKINIRELLNSSVWIAKQLWKVAPFDTATLSILIVLDPLTSAISAFVSAKVIDQLIKVAQNSQPTDITLLLTTNNPLTQSIIFALLAFAIRHIIRESEYYLQFKFRIYHIRWLQMNYMYKVSELDISQFDNDKTASEIMRGSENIEHLRTFIRTAIYLLSQIFSIIINFVILSRLHIAFPTVIFLTALPTAYFFYKWIARDWEFEKDISEKRKQWRWAQQHFTDSKLVPENRVSSSLSTLRKGIEKSTEQIFGGYVRLRKTLYRQDLAATSILLLGEIVYTIFPIVKVLSGQITVGDFTFFIGRARQFSADIDAAFSNASEAYSVLARVSEAKSVMEIKNRIVSGIRKVTKKNPPKIEFRDVSFKYPGSNKYSLRNFNMIINPGEEIAIVGENGAGKSTFIKLLLRFYDPEKGQILIDDIDIRELDLDDYYRKVGSLFQDYLTYRFLTVEENITIGASKKDKKEVKNALLNADAWGFIEDTELKTKHRLHKQFEDGIQLSKGQEQKLALARMFYRDAPILILDEPTASIDAVAEYKIFKHIYSFMKNKTVIIVSHRFSTVRNAQKIYIFDKGRIIEEGSHKELLEKNGVYAKAFKLQAEGYTN